MGAEVLSGIRGGGYARLSEADLEGSSHMVRVVSLYGDGCHIWGRDVVEAEFSYRCGVVEEKRWNSI
ncbi:uncharacterized protein G2W53_018972 [Senna tora]|uniref:Uncharacterized protein n=1 Tax=Senna tora TaxID=362788 RepID=A0A834WNU5_9FABA|nr:uncharacterized protein G2W53_018972 [Senna tora]